MKKIKKILSVIWIIVGLLLHLSIFIIIKTKDDRSLLGFIISVIVLEYGQEFRLLNVKMARSFFGNIISGTDSIEDELSENLKSLVSN